ncbi:MAG: sortase, partial [Acidimicrobiales bacterium]
PHDRSARTYRRATWVRNIGLIILLFVPYQLWGTAFEQHRSQAGLRAEFAAALKGGGDAPTLPGALPTGGQAAGATAAGNPVRRAVLPGGVVGRLQIPAIHLDQFVVEGTSEGDLRKGPGHYAGSSLLGQHGNAAIAGHRTTYGAPFGRLEELKAGDTIEATTPAGKFLYVVSGHFVVNPGQSSVVDDYGDDRLTLTTCTPRFTATHRLIVTAKLEGPITDPPPARVAAPAPLAARPVSSSGPAVTQLRATGLRGWDWGALPLSLLAALFLAGLAWLYRPLRRRLPPAAGIALLAPFWIAGLLVLFEQATRLLPPNV